jgi:hypothetical protein
MEEVKTSLATLPGFQDTELELSRGLENFALKTTENLQQTVGEVEEKLTRIHDGFVYSTQSHAQSTEQNILMLARGASKMKDEINNLRSDYRRTSRYSLSTNGFGKVYYKFIKYGHDGFEK